MKTGICPKCDSATVYRYENGFVTGDRFAVRVRVPRKMLPVTATADDLVCVTCGYFERYLRRGEALNMIKEQWAYVEPQ